MEWGLNLATDFSVTHEMASNEQQQYGMLTANELLALSEGAKSPVGKSPRSRQASGHGLTTETPLSERMARISVLPNPPVEGKINNDLVKRKFEKARVNGCLDFIAGLPRDLLDTRAVSAKNKGLGNYTTNEMIFQHFAKDGELFNYLKQVNPANYGRDEMEPYVSALEKSVKSIGSSGSLSGVTTRLANGMVEAPRVTLNVSKCVAWANAVLKYVPVTNDFRGKSLADMIAIAEPKLKFNVKSNAGVPYYKTISTPGVFKAALETGTEVLNAIADGSFNTLIRKRPSLLAVLLKNKQDIYEVSKLQTRIRPYFVYPLHERLMYSLLHTGLKGELFVDNPFGISGSAIGFSWNYGGGDRLYRWIISKLESGPGFYTAFYGDDQLWVVVIPSGDAYIFTPDFSHMDMSLAAGYGKIAYIMWRKAFGDNLDKTWDAILKLNCTRAFNRAVVIDGALTMQFKHGLASGIPGTSKFDEVASAVVCGYLKEKYNLVKGGMQGVQDVVAWLMEEKETIQHEFGLIFKEGSLHPYPFERDRENYEFVFLGQTLTQVYGGTNKHYVPKPDLEKLVVSATTLKKSYKSGDVKTRARMAAARSLYAQGGYHYPPLAHGLQAAFEAMTKRGYRPIDSDEDEYYTETEHSVFMDVTFAPGDHSWPSRDWCVNLYLPPDDRRDEQSGRDLDEMSEPQSGSGVAEAGPTVDRYDMVLEDLDDFTLEEDIEESFEDTVDKLIMPTNWHDQAVLDREGDDDAGIADNPQNKAVRPEYMGRIQPLSPEKKAAYKKKLQDDAAERRAARERAYSNRNAQIRKLKPSQMRGKAYNKLTRQQRMLEVLLNDHDNEYQDGEEDYFGDYMDVRDE